VAIPKDHVMETCRPGAGEKTCRYLMMGPGGWECAKLQEGFKRTLDERVAANTITAQADNCPGLDKEGNPPAVPPEELN